MAGGPNADIVPCLYCGGKSSRISEGREDDFYRCEQCGRRFSVDWSGRPPVTPQWPPADPTAKPLFDLDWRDMAVFQGVDLLNSLLLGWELRLDGLVFYLVASVGPDHPAYQLPKGGGARCTRLAELIFSNPTALSGLKPMDIVTTTMGIDGVPEYGTIEELVVHYPKRFNVTGMFGDVSFEGDLPSLNFPESV